jgi:hypothetical protein
MSGMDLERYAVPGLEGAYYIKDWLPAPQAEELSQKVVEDLITYLLKKIR